MDKKGLNERLNHLSQDDAVDHLMKDTLLQGADVNYQSTTGKTALHWTSNRNSSKGFKILMDFGANLDLQDNNGDTPLHLAVYGSARDLIQLLLSHGANDNIKNKDGLTAYELAVELKYHATVELFQNFYERQKLLKMVDTQDHHPAGIVL